MPMTEIFDGKFFSIGIGSQAGINDPAAAITWVKCRLVEATPDASQIDIEHTKSMAGEESPALPGREWWNLSITLELHGQPDDYDHTTDTPDYLGMMALLPVLLGNTASVSRAAAGADSSGTDGNKVSFDASPNGISSLLATGTAAGAVHALGIGKSQSGAGPYVVTMMEDMGALAVTNDDRLPTKTLSPSGNLEATYYTIAVSGQDGYQDRAYVGFVPKTFARTIESDYEVITFTGTAYGGEVLGEYGGELHEVTEFLELPPLLADANARYTFASNVGVSNDLNDGVIDPEGTCDVRVEALRIEVPHIISKAPRGQGVCDVTVGNPKITADVSVPIISEFDYPGESENILVHAWRIKQGLSLGCYRGATAGTIVAWNMPRGIPATRPTRVMKDGAEHYQTTLKATKYTENTADNAVFFWGEG